MGQNNHKIVEINKLQELTLELKNQGKKIILVGGVFDILHSGHLFFLEEAKKVGDVLIILLESDENVKKKKGPERPINSSKRRSSVLSSVENVDYIIPLQGVTKDEEYDRLMSQIQPFVIAMTKGDKNISEREKQAKKIGAKIKLIEKIEGISTSALIN